MRPPSDALSVLAQRNCRFTGVPAALYAVTAPPLMDSLVKVGDIVADDDAGAGGAAAGARRRHGGR